MTSRTGSPRLAFIDALRGAAVAQMIVYHFCYDLSYYGWLHQLMTQVPGWVAWRTAIVTQFLLLVGVGSVLRASLQPARARFWRRWAQIAGAALLVSFGSHLLFGPRLIWFGILHFVALALLLTLPLARLGRWLWLLAALAAVAGVTLHDAHFDSDAVGWIGFATRRPATEDFVPLFPWIAAVIAGIAAGQAWRAHGFVVVAPLRRLAQRPPRVLVLLGRRALTVYLVHQPLMMGALWLVKRAIA